MYRNFLATFLLTISLFFNACKDKTQDKKGDALEKINSSEINSSHDYKYITKNQLMLQNNIPFGIPFGVKKDEIKSKINDSVFQDLKDTLTYTHTFKKDFWDYSFVFNPTTQEYMAFYLDFYCLDSTLANQSFMEIKNTLMENESVYGKLTLSDSTVWNGETECCITQLEWISDESDLGYQLVYTKK